MLAQCTALLCFAHLSCPPHLALFKPELLHELRRECLTEANRAARRSAAQRSAEAAQRSAATECTTDCRTDQQRGSVAYAHRRLDVQARCAGSSTRQHSTLSAPSTEQAPMASVSVPVSPMRSAYL